MKRGFTLIEMLVVIGIIVVLMAAALGAYSKMAATADRTNGQELVSNVATALNVYFQEHGRWPNALLSAASGKTGGKVLDEKAAKVFARNKLITVSYLEDKETKEVRLTGLDRFGIVSPWATRTLKRKGVTGGSADSINVVTGGTVKDHLLHFDIDTDGKGFVETSVGGNRIKVRANAIVWCAGRDGVMVPYPYAGGNSGKATKGRISDDCYSWTPLQVEK